jgi:Predicted membrane protein
MENQMSFAEAIKILFSMFVTFEGRVRCSELWCWILLTAIAEFVLGLLGMSETLLSSILSLTAFISGLTVAVRRLHDIDKIGWTLFFGSFPLIGAIMIFMKCERQWSQ